MLDPDEASVCRHELPEGDVVMSSAAKLIDCTCCCCDDGQRVTIGTIEFHRRYMAHIWGLTGALAVYNRHYCLTYGGRETGQRGWWFWESSEGGVNVKLWVDYDGYFRLTCYDSGGSVTFSSAVIPYWMYGSVSELPMPNEGDTYSVMC